MTWFDGKLFPLWLLSLSEDVEEEEAIEVSGEGQYLSSAGGQSFSDIEIENVYFFEIE